MLCLLLLLIISHAFAKCENSWYVNSTIEEQATEPVNAFSSLAFCAFGIYGFVVLSRQSSLYCVVLCLFVITGISSFMHHIKINDRLFHAMDIISMYLLATFSWTFMICESGLRRYKITFVSMCFASVCLCVIILAMFVTNTGDRQIVFQIVLGLILMTQIVTNYALFKSTENNSFIRYSIFSLIAFIIAGACWLIDVHSCLQFIPFHTTWHILIAYALFNSLQTTLISKCEFLKLNKKMETWSICMNITIV